jgi:RNA polymerase sigma-70 factor (ECF subfamily)
MTIATNKVGIGDISPAAYFLRISLNWMLKRDASQLNRGRHVFVNPLVWKQNDTHRIDDPGSFAPYQRRLDQPKPFEISQVMLITAQVVISLLFFIAETFPDEEGSAFASVDTAALLARAQKGDREAVALLYEIFSQAIFRYIVIRVPTTADAEDLTAEVFVTMVKALPTYEMTGAPFEAWLYRVASARVADFHRRAYRRPQTELSETLHDVEPLPEEGMQQKQRLDQLRSLFTELPEEHQTILILRFVERKSHEEVALILNKTVASVKSTQHRALTRLTELMGSRRKVRHYLRGDHE